jgi:hypothetical protein
MDSPQEEYQSGWSLLQHFKNLVTRINDKDYLPFYLSTEANH